MFHRTVYLFACIAVSSGLGTGCASPDGGHESHGSVASLEEAARPTIVVSFFDPDAPVISMDARNVGLEGLKSQLTVPAGLAVTTSENGQQLLFSNSKNAPFVVGEAAASTGSFEHRVGDFYIEAKAYRLTSPLVTVVDSKLVVTFPKAGSSR